MVELLSVRVNVSVAVSVTSTLTDGVTTCEMESDIVVDSRCVSVATVVGEYVGST